MVSCVISEVLEDSTKHVAVEPDPSVIEALLCNRGENGGSFIYSLVLYLNMSYMNMAHIQNHLKI